MNNVHINPLWRASIVALALLIPTIAAAQTAQVTPQRVRGQIIAFEGTDLQMRADNGQSLRVRLTNEFSIGAVSRGDLSRIVADAYIGVAGMPQPDGSIQAVDIRVFPEAMRGTGEGHRPMNVAAGTTMTNASVSVAAGAPATQTMTNATVSDVSNAEATRRITLKYATGEKVVLVRPDTPVLIIQTGDRSMLIPGARITATLTTQADGSLTSDRLTVGVNGAVPPP